MITIDASGNHPCPASSKANCEAGYLKLAGAIGNWDEHTFRHGQILLGGSHHSDDGCVLLESRHVALLGGKGFCCIVVCVGMSGCGSACGSW